MTIHITKTKALRLLREAVAKRGADYVYKKPGATCKYVVKGDQPSCMVGEVLLEAGLDPKVLYRTPLNKLSINSLVDELDPDVIQVDDAARVLLNEAQVFQDIGSTWGEALREARAKARHFAEYGW